MSVLTSMKCPSCGNQSNVPEEYLGRRILCIRCKATFRCGISRKKSLGQKVSEALERRADYCPPAEADFSTVSHYPAVKTIPQMPAAPKTPAVRSPSNSINEVKSSSATSPTWLWITAPTLCLLLLLTAWFMVTR